MKKHWNTPRLFSLSIEETNSGNTTYWNETCLQENLKDFDLLENEEKRKGYFVGSETAGCRNPDRIMPMDQGSTVIVITPPNAAAAGS